MWGRHVGVVSGLQRRRRRGGRGAEIGGIISQHVGGRQQLDRTGDVATLDGTRVESHMAFAPVRHGRRDLGTFVALGEGARDGRHGEKID